MSKCFFTDCEKSGVFQCSRCKKVKYCCAEHQKLDWNTHKRNCSAGPSPIPATGNADVPSENKGSDVPLGQSTDQRHCRCMFCGEALVLGSEEEAVGHMKVCVALQEQLASKDQFTVPSIVKEKYTKN